MAGLALSLAAAACSAGEQCIALETRMEVRSGAQLAPVDKVAEGEEVFYTVRATNICREPLPTPVIEYAIPPHMFYVSGSAIGPAAGIEFSIDGGFQFADATTLANPAAYTHIRWVLRTPLPPSAMALLRFRAVFQ